MDGLFISLRRATIITIGLASIGVGLALVFLLVRAGVLPRIGTSALAGTLALLVLPVMTFGAVAMDRRAALRQPALRRPTQGR